MLAVIVVPLLAAWGISVGYRCASVRAQGPVHVLAAALMVVLVSGILVGGEPLLWVLGVMVVIVVAVEALLALGVLPTEHSFEIMFRNIPVDLRIVASGGREAFRTNVARTLDATTLLRLSRLFPESTYDGAALPQDIRSTHSGTFPHSVFKAYKLRAGTAVIIEDTTRLDSLQSQLEQQRDYLLSQNEVLRRYSAMRGLLYRQQRERELSERVELDLAKTTHQISAILDNQLSGEGPNGEAERLEQLNLVKVLVAYSKRKGMLALAGAESDVMQGVHLETIAREAMADLGSIGIECAVFVTARGPLAMAAVNTVYDCFYDCILSVLPRVRPVIMVSIAQKPGAEIAASAGGTDGAASADAADGASSAGDAGDAGDTGDAGSEAVVPLPGSLEMRATIECAIGLESGNATELIPSLATPAAEPWTAVQMAIANDLEDRLAARNVDHSVRLDEGLVSVVVNAHASNAGGAPEDVQAGEAS